MSSKVTHSHDFVFNFYWECNHVTSVQWPGARSHCLWRFPIIWCHSSESTTLHLCYNLEDVLPSNGDQDVGKHLGLNKPSCSEGPHSCIKGFLKRSSLRKLLSERKTLRCWVVHNPRSFKGFPREKNWRGFRLKPVYETEHSMKIALQCLCKRVEASMFWGS